MVIFKIRTSLRLKCLNLEQLLKHSIFQVTISDALNVLISKNR